MKISSIIFVQMTLCQSAILVTQSTVNIFFGKLSSINILKTKHLRQYIWFYYTFFKNKTTEFGSNCYICPKGSYDKVLCIFFPGCSVSFLGWHTTIRYRPRFFDQVGHQTTYASIGNKHFINKIMSSSDLPKL